MKKTQDLRQKTKDKANKKDQTNCEIFAACLIFYFTGLLI